MSRKKKSQLRQECVLKSARLRFYAILEIYSERKLQLYKKADLERKRRCRARFIKHTIKMAALAERKQQQQEQQQQEAEAAAAAAAAEEVAAKDATGKKEKIISQLTSFRCVFCRELTPAIHRLWWAVLCSVCYYNPFCIQTIVHETLQDIAKSQITPDVQPDKIMQLYEDLLQLENKHYHEIKNKQWNLNDGYKYYMLCSKFFRTERIAEIQAAKATAQKAYAALRKLKHLSAAAAAEKETEGDKK